MEKKMKTYNNNVLIGEKDLRKCTPLLTNLEMKEILPENEKAKIIILLLIYFWMN